MPGVKCVPHLSWDGANVLMLKQKFSGFKQLTWYCIYIYISSECSLTSSILDFGVCGHYWPVVILMASLCTTWIFSKLVNWR